MTRMSADDLKAELAKIINPSIAELLLITYLEMQQRYFAEDWQPTELDGGRFCEAVARAVYQMDSGTVSHSKLPGEVVEYLLDLDKSGKHLPVLHPHKLDSKDRNHFCRVLQTVYKFRSDRGAVHVSPIYTANHLDAAMVVANVKWLFAEFLRLGWNKDRSQVAELIESIIELEHPLVHELDGVPLVLASSLSAPEEVLVLLRHAGERGLKREDLRRFVKASQSAVDTAVHRLVDRREARLSSTGDVVITPLGVQRFREGIVSKLTPHPVKPSNAVPRSNPVSISARKSNVRRRK